jgi:hypothetical protein
MRKIYFSIVLLLAYASSSACPVCEKKQPKVLQGIAHGAGPESQWDYVIVWGIVAITVLTLFFAIKWLIKPGEKEENHIKRMFLTFE